MEAIVLAAGLGTRLHPLTDGCPKCLVEVNGVSILENQLSALESVNVEQTTIVVGNLKSLVKERIGQKYRDMNICYAENLQFNVTGTGYSFLRGLDCVRQSFYLLEGDVVFDPVLLKILADSYQNDQGFIQAAVVPFLPPLEGTTVALDVQSCVINIRRGEPVGTSPDRFKTVNAYLFGGRHRTEILLGLHDFIRTAPVNASLEDFFHHCLNKSAINLRGVDCSCLDWVEIDTPEDHRRACAILGYGKPY